MVCIQIKINSALQGLKLESQTQFPALNYKKYSYLWEIDLPLHTHTHIYQSMRRFILLEEVAQNFGELCPACATRVQFT